MRSLVRVAPALAFTALLGACADADREATAETAPVPAQTAMPVEPDGGIGDGAGPPQAAADTIPARFRGVWDYVEGTCMPASDLRMDIRADEIEFYESLGEVRSVAVESPDSIVVTLAMTGEGESWEVTNRLALSEGGTVLTPFETDDNSQYRPMPRKRCSQ